MVLIRDVFQAKYGKSGELVALFKEAGQKWPDAMQYGRAFQVEVLSRYEATLPFIDQRRRKPTPWEAQCLLSALYSIATDSWSLAEYNLNRCRRGPRGRRPATPVTTNTLRQALAEIRCVHDT